MQRLACVSRPMTIASSPTLKVAPLSLPEMAASRGSMMRLCECSGYVQCLRVLSSFEQPKGASKRSSIQTDKPSHQTLSDWIALPGLLVLAVASTCLVCKRFPKNLDKNSRCEPVAHRSQQVVIAKSRIAKP